MSTIAIAQALDMATRLRELAEVAPSIAPELHNIADRIEGNAVEPDLAERNRLIAAYRRKHIPRIAEDRAAASVLETRLARYEQGSWRSDQHENTCPYDAATSHAYLWYILKAGPAIKAEQIRKLDAWVAARPTTQTTP